ncbi:membrane-bound PQQ-dependent dehydrogenase, glucose/quinate/shikimate family [Brucella gallinifaecis]|uniref:Membrane-bound PQQ-dependent dehydrogenase, glucose/quinate/shikimate family n=1 Tax=Brucella gallinifaecis TaxID=215590 RepID=A0A502BM00_9HYPH|nr:membrane-bound PQQ-dependent dehydrogenase, glucose/quinate/shikimate family [Brucella gallinifaecis]TPF74358.1 membrane-bound PQQ-dependent dehydrogenase, glucose/quinate/shikimate family [Brucella gallinifaecis]
MENLRRAFSIILAVAGIYLVVLGGRLLFLGGSPYYLLVGIIYVVAVWLMWKQDRRSVWLISAVLLITVLWSAWEVHGIGAYWGWLARLMVPLGFAIVAALLFASFRDKAGKACLGAAALGAVCFAAVFARAFINVPYVAATNGDDYKIAQSDNKPIDWTAYSRDTMGIRFSPFTQINRDNVKDLKVAWTYRTGRDFSNANSVDQNTPLQIGNTLYACTPENAVHAINATTGERKWLYEAKAKSYTWARCRGLGYYENTAAVSGEICAKRIVGNTVDGRLYELDAETGALCPQFGTNGEVDLRANMGVMGPGYYYQNSAPLVAGDKIIVGGWVSDNQNLSEPSGAIRAFDALTGTLVWTWDPGNPDVARDPLNDGEYTAGTPNMWTHAAFDPALGVVYAPMGNAGTDYYNAKRPEHSLEYNAALVALDVNTGKPKWSFQTVHDDLWDYDIPSQPALLDMKNDAGEMVPAVLIFTKRGQIFALDRRDGTPISKVEELPVPTTGTVPENRVSPTQPYSVDMPVINSERFTEASSWGMTMFDQLLCRISYKQMRYDGDFTLPGLDWTLSSPGVLGGQNWGSASYDPLNRRLFVNDIRLGDVKRMMTRPEYDKALETRTPSADGHGLAPMDGTPYAIENGNWYSPLGVPCQQPPLGTVTAIDLDTRSIAWQMPGGTAEQLGPLNIKLGLPLTLGMPTYAGTSVTAGGIVFFAGTQDFYLRAYDAATGEELVKVPLPVGASATPMVFISPENGKEYVVLSVGGAAHSAAGDYLMAFTLPE